MAEIERRPLAENVVFISGVGDRDGKRLCIMSAAAWIAGEPHGDAPVCACPVLRSLAIRLNDAAWWESDDERTRALMPLAEQLVGTKSTRAVEVERARVAVHRTMTVITPRALDRAADRLDARLPEHAAKLRERAAALRALTLKQVRATKIDPDLSAHEVARLAREAAYEAWRAARAAVDADAADAADAAVDAADAYDAAYAAAYAGAAVDAAVDAADPSRLAALRMAARRQARDDLRALIVDLIAIREVAP